MDCPIHFDERIDTISSQEVSSSCGINFPRQLKVSPDGLYALLSNEDNTVQIWSLPTGLINKHRYYQLAGGNPGGDSEDLWKLSSINNIGESIYDIAWYPLMNAATEGTSCYAVTSKDHPIHLYDATTHDIRCSYNGINRLDELDSARSLCFNNDGSRLYAGSDRVVRCFDLASPGRQISEVHTTKNRKDKSGIKGIISCLSFNPDVSGAYAAGSFANSVGVYVENQNRSALELQNLSCGVTGLKWSRCGSYLWIGGRKSKDLLCWDIRHTRCEVGRVPRAADTNQKLSFDIDPWGKYVASGDTQGCLRVYSTSSFELVAETQSVGTSLSNVCFHPWSALLVGCSGARWIQSPAHTDSEDSDSGSECNSDDTGSEASGTRDGTDCGPNCGKEAVGANVHVWGFDYTPVQYSVPAAVETANC